MAGRVTQLLGDTPLRVAVKLVVVSFLVGVVMSTFGWSPIDIFYGIRDFIESIWNLGFRAFERFFAYIVLGAAVVVPAFIILRMLNMRRR